MDCDAAGNKQEQYDEISNKMKCMLPIAGWTGESLLKKSDDMLGWKGAVVFVDTTQIHPDTLYDVLDKVCKLPSRPLSAPMRMPISGIYKIDVNSVKYDSHLKGS